LFKENNIKVNFRKDDMEKNGKGNIEMNRMISDTTKKEVSSFRSSRTSTTKNSNMDKLNLKIISNLKITTIIMIIPICYLITTLPTFIIIILQMHSIFYHPNVDYDFPSLMAIAQTLMYINNSIIVFLYVLLGKSLRNELIAMFFVCFKKNTNSEASLLI
jgi:hypothetical protein